MIGRELVGNEYDLWKMLISDEEPVRVAHSLHCTEYNYLVEDHTGQFIVVNLEGDLYIQTLDQWERHKNGETIPQEVLDKIKKPKIVTGIEMITQERQEQINRHGFTIEEDKRYTRRQLQSVAIFAINGDRSYYPNDWDIEYKVRIQAKSEIERLKVAGALIAAEIDRLQNELY